MRKPVLAICEQRRCRSACASAQSDQHLYCSLPIDIYYNTSGFYTRNFKPLPSFCGWAGGFESYLVENPEDRFSRDGAHFKFIRQSQAKVKTATVIALHHYSNAVYVWNHNWTATWQNQESECAPSEDSDQPGHPPSLIKVFAIRMKKAWFLNYLLSAQRRLWSDWANTQADLSLRWAHSHIIGFVMSRLIFEWRQTYCIIFRIFENSGKTNQSKQDMWK